MCMNWSCSAAIYTKKHWKLSSDHYCGWCCLGCKNGRKKGTAETWLVDLVRSGNGAILPGCEAIKIRQEKKHGSERNRAKGIAFEFGCGSGAKQMCLVESKVTIVACGALSTPPLLKKSGLRNPNIGKNLHLHPVTMAWGHFPAENSSFTDNPWPEEHKRSYEGGIMTAMCNIGSEPDEPGYGGAVIQTPALHPGLFSVLMPWVSGTNIKHRMCKFSRTAHVFALARDKGSGTVKSSSSISYEIDRLDEEHLQKGLEKALKILAAAGAEEIGTHHNKGRSINVKKVSYREYQKFVKEESSRPLKDLLTPICSAHQMGSCRMGIGPKDSVVNQRGETWEVEGLFIADSSVFPTALGVNPMVTIQAIAYCTAHSVLETLQDSFLFQYHDLNSHFFSKLSGRHGKASIRLRSKLFHCRLPHPRLLRIMYGCRVSFGIAVAMMSGATSISRRQEYGKGWMEGECYVVKDGIFVGAALLVLINGASTIGSAAIGRRSRVNGPSQIHAQIG